MRVLFSSTRGAGHFNPLVPFANAFVRAGHELLFAGPPDLAGPVDAAGFRLWQFDPPPEDELAVLAVSQPLPGHARRGNAAGHPPLQRPGLGRGRR